MPFGLPTPTGSLGAAGLASFALPFGHEGQYFAQPLVLNNGRLIDLLEPVKGAMGQVAPLVPDAQTAVRVVDHRDALAGEGTCDFVRFEKEQHLVVLRNGALSC